MKLRAFRLKHPTGVHATIVNYGARLHKLGISENHNVVVAAEKVEDYLTCTAFQGATIGPIANLVRNGEISTDKAVASFHKNHGSHSLHSGNDAYDKRYWSVVLLNENSVKLSLEDEHSFANCKINVSVLFELTPFGLDITYEASSDSDFWMNMTNHSYFNLVQDKDIYGHSMSINSNKVVATDESNIPTSMTVDIENERDCFIRSKELSLLREDLSTERLKKNNGINTCYLLQRSRNYAALVSHPEARVNLLITTTKPALQVYTTNNPIKLCERNSLHGAVCLEPMYPTSDYFEKENARSYITCDRIYKETDSYNFV
ncbi:hypothetical protein P7F88_04305 [Vibrio hannami]|uniref:aldose epimerase family protein n=1 Tax=Vibrio hannami TaxID=2717094 RepID=UPI00240ED158|nr:hypothetical protein [Vibrio hannami]MDG3085366.1 hypothetical protein [Vibrio hannami]